MSTRRALLGVAAVAVTVPVRGSGAPRTFLATIHRPQHRDAKLLALCARLEAMQAEWQRLYDATSEEDELTTLADHAWQAYSDDVWPGLNRSPWSRERRDPTDLPGRLADLPATTPEGLRAKAAAVLALDEAAGYLTDCRNDSAELWQSVIRDAAGSAHRPLGADAPASRTPLRPVPLTT